MRFDSNRVIRKRSDRLRHRPSLPLDYVYFPSRRPHCLNPCGRVPLAGLAPFIIDLPPFLVIFAPRSSASLATTFCVPILQRFERVRETFGNQCRYNFGEGDSIVMRVVGGKSRGPHSIINLREARERYIVLSSSNCHSPWLIGKYQVLVAQTCITLTFRFCPIILPHELFVYRFAQCHRFFH